MSTPIPAVSFAPTPEQSAIVDAVRNLQPGELLKIQARAGTGKTSTLELLARAQKRLQPNQTLETMSNLSDSLEKIRARARANKAAEAPPPPKLVARQTPEQRQQCFDARVAEFVRAGMTHEEAAAAATKEGW